MTDDESEYHETQRARDCSVHSLNNAVGRKALTAPEVVAEIKRRVAAFQAEVQRLGYEEKATLRQYRRSLADGKTYFTAEAVWVAALSLGRIGSLPRPVNGAIVDSKTLQPAPFLVEWVASKNHAFIVLGKTKEGAYHAVAIREGKIRDSLRDEPLDFAQESLADIYAEIFGVYMLQRL